MRGCLKLSRHMKVSVRQETIISIMLRMKLMTEFTMEILLMRIHVTNKFRARAKLKRDGESSEYPGH